MTLPLELAGAPAAFTRGLATLYDVLGGAVRPGLVLHAVPSPRRLAPWSVAVAAELARGGEQVASGRFVVLHDPAGQQGWGGDTRVVALVEAGVDAEMAADPILPQVGWAWLRESLEQRGARHDVLGGTVTRTISQRFGELADAGPDAPDDSNEVEVRASWTPQPVAAGLDLGRHLLAWCDLLCCAAGLPPVTAR